MADTEIKGFSAPEMRFITAFFSNIIARPEVDWDKVASDASLKDARCARDRFRQIMAKHGLQAATAGASPRKVKKGGEEPEGSALTKVTKRAPRKKAVKKEKKEGEEDEEPKFEVKTEDVEGAEGGMPASAKKRAPRKKAVKKTVEKTEEEEKGEEGGDVKVKDSSDV